VIWKVAKWAKEGLSHVILLNFEKAYN